MKKPLVQSEHLTSVLKTQNRLIHDLFRKYSGIDMVNDMYQYLSKFNRKVYLDTFFKKLNINFEISEEDLTKIPKEGSLVVISNHPYGGIDGLSLLNILERVRPDVKVMANHLLQRIEPLTDSFIPVNSLEQYKGTTKSIGGLRMTMKHLKTGGAIVIFPSGQVSTFNNGLKIRDREWVDSSIKLIKRAKTKVVPIYFHGKNSLLFQLVGFIHPLLRTARLPKEMFNRSNSTIKISIGNPISVEKQNTFSNLRDYKVFLRSKVDELNIQ